MTESRAELVGQARRMLRGEAAGAAELLHLATHLKGYHAFDYARRLLAKARAKAAWYWYACGSTTSESRTSAQPDRVELTLDG